MRRIHFICMLLCLTTFAARFAQAQTETVLYNFCSQSNCSDGSNPTSRLTFDGAGNLYGTTYSGGAFGLGTIFELSPDGGGGWNETVLHSFTGGADGANPTESYVLFDGAGNLYGTALYGGAYEYGVVFELSPVGANWTETILYNFTNGADGGNPINGLIMDGAGNFYGTNYLGVFELSPSGGNWTGQLIQSVPIRDGGLVMDAAGNLFSTTRGTVFELSPNGSGGWNSNTIYTLPYAYAAEGRLWIDKARNLYGESPNGGNGKGGHGNVFEVSPTRKGWRGRTLHAFHPGGQLSGDGDDPLGGLVVDAAGNVYGTSVVGGEWRDGAVFELVAPVGGGRYGRYEEKLMWSFNGTDGANPNGGLILDNAGNLYGTAGGGGLHGYGVVFEVTP